MYPLLVRVEQAAAGVVSALSLYPDSSPSHEPGGLVRHASPAVSLMNKTALGRARLRGALMLPVSPAPDPLSDPCDIPTKQVTPLRC